MSYSGGEPDLRDCVAIWRTPSQFWVSFEHVFILSWRPCVESRGHKAGRSGRNHQFKRLLPWEDEASVIPVNTDHLWFLFPLGNKTDIETWRCQSWKKKHFFCTYCQRKQLALKLEKEKEKFINYA